MFKLYNDVQNYINELIFFLNNIKNFYIIRKLKYKEVFFKK